MSVFFVSDAHLGVPNYVESLEREKKLVRLLDYALTQNLEQLFLVGDLFDFWFEYTAVAPKGYVRLLGKLAEIADKGIPIHCFTGNHDMWMFGYLAQEIGLQMHHHPQLFELQGKKWFVGHGDGLGPGDYGYKFLKKVFANKVCQWAFARLHPNFSFKLAQFWSYKSRINNTDAPEFIPEKEWIYQYCTQYAQSQPNVHGFIVGHRHLPILTTVKTGAQYLNLGDWITYFTYGRLDEGVLSLHAFKG